MDSAYSDDRASVSDIVFEYVSRKKGKKKGRRRASVSAKQSQEETNKRDVYTLEGEGYCDKELDRSADSVKRESDEELDRSADTVKCESDEEIDRYTDTIPHEPDERLDRSTDTLKRQVDEEFDQSAALNDPEYLESGTDKVGVDKLLSRRLILDAVMSCPPKLSRTPSLEHSGPMLDARPERNVVINTRALPKEAKTYELEKFRKNCLIIFNQELIDGFEPRLGTRQDVEALKETFGNFGFEVVEHADFTKRQIMEVLDTFKTTNFTEYGCVAVAVLTHGSFNGLLRAKDQVYSETEIINYFRVYDKPTLVTKPKILIIQACRGTRCLPGVYVAAQSDVVRKDLDEDIEPYTLPVTSDMLIVHSSYIGEASTRDELHGSWFIQTLCRKINELSASHDLQSILTEVKREVAADRHWEEYNRVTMEIDQFKQMPTVTTTLIRKLYLRRFGDESPPVSFVDMSEPGPSRAPVLDVATTPMLVQLGPCSCFLDHFEYIKRCLTLYLEENPADEVARTFLELSDTFENEDKFNTAKERMTKAMSQHLMAHAAHCHFHKYLYFYKQ